MAVSKFWVLFGSHSGGPDRIKVGLFDAHTGEITPPQAIIESRNPGYFIFTPDARFLYACNQSDGFEPGVSGGVTAFHFDDRTGRLNAINTVSAHGIDPSHLAFDRSRRHLFIANYSSGTFSIRAIASDGSLGRETAWRQLKGSSIDPIRQRHSYAHASALDPSGRYVLVCDLGADKVWVFHYAAETGELLGEPTFAMTPPGHGARHLAFHPNGKWLYVDGEMGNSVSRFDWDASSGALTIRYFASTLPADFTGASATAEILISDDGRRLYVTNRGHDSVATLDIDAKSGDPTAVDFVPTGGGMPRNLEFSPDRKWAVVSNHLGNNFQIYGYDSASGRLRVHGAPIELEAPYCPRFVAVRE
jgi:6-phosphogluconolactonase